MPGRIAILLNPRSGSAPDCAALAAALEKARVAADIHALPEAGVTAWLADIARGYDVLVAAGGDGTVSAVAQAAAATGKVLGVIPAGTLNHFARDAGLPLELDDAIALLSAGSTRLLDLGVVNDRSFLNNASLGAYPRMVWERNQARQRGVPRPVATALAVIDTWIELCNMAVRLCVDGRELVRQSPIVVVGNSKYEVEGLQLGRRLTLTDGTLSLYVAPGLGRVDALALPVRSLLGRLKTHEKFEAWIARSITVDTSQPHVSVALDGEVTRIDPPLRFSVRQRALRLIVPREKVA